MLSNDEHDKILQFLERDMAGSANVPPGSSLQPPASRIVDLTDVPDLLALPVEPVAWLVQAMIPRAAVTLVAGEPGSYKSWLALRLARAVSEGAMFLGRACPRLPVLYLDRENPQAVVRERMEVLEMKGRRLEAGTPGWETQGSGPQPQDSSLQPPTPNLRIWGGWLRDEPPLIGDARLLQIARRWKPLIIFDSLIRFHEGDENSATEMAPVMGELRALAHAGATVVALHHRAKSEASRYRGSSDILGGVDVAFTVSRLPAWQGQAGLPARQGQMGLPARQGPMDDRDAGLLKLQCFKSRFGAELALTLRPELETTGDFALADPPGVSREAADVEALRQLIAAEPGLSQREVLRRAGMAKHHTISLLRGGEGTLWQSEQGSRRSMRYYPLSSSDQEPGVTGVRQCDGP